MNLKSAINPRSKFCRIWKISVLFLLFLCITPFQLTAQSKEVVSGKVTDNQGNPLPGATITVKGTSNGVISDGDGMYTLKNVTPKSILIFSFIGMTSKSVIAASQKEINIVLEEDQVELDEVVVIGYGESRRSDLTGSVKGVNATKIGSQSLVSAEMALLGRVAGARVTQDNSPGGGMNIVIRGSNSMLGGTEPLYVVDGFPLEPLKDARGNSTAGESQQQSSMSFINPDDIENIEVLKDASATAIYGARGANGVVLITTKSGKSGKISISYNFRNEFSTIEKKLDVMNGEEYANMLNQQQLNRFYIDMTAPSSAGAEKKAINLPFNGVNRPVPNANENTDWQDAIFRNVLSQNHTLQISGSSPNTKYAFSLGYRNQQGIIINSDYQRFTYNSNIEQKVNKKLTITSNINFARSNSNGTSSSTGDVWGNRSIVTSAIMMQPIFKLNADLEDAFEGQDYFDLNGTDLEINNPYRIAMLSVDKKINNSLTSLLSANYDLNKDFKLYSKIGVNINNAERYQYWPRTLVKGRQNNGIATISVDNSQRLLGEARITYNHLFARNHTVNLMGAYTIEDNDRTTRYNTYAGFPNDNLSYDGINFALTHFPTEFDKQNYKLLSYISRANYKYKDKYLVTATLRADGSSRFSQNHKWGVFPSLAAAWRISEEKWMPKNEIVDNIKLRTSYGQTGSESGIGSYSSLGIMKYKYYSFDDVANVGIYESNIANPDLKWETTDQYNLGLDANLFNNRVILVVDLYLKRTHDLLQNVVLPGSFGYLSKIVNMGEVENKGIEFDLTIPIFKSKKMDWTISGNGSINRNKLLSLGGLHDFVLGPTMNYRANRFIVGQPLGVFWGLGNTGVFKNWDEAISSGIKDAIPGEYHFKNNFVDYQQNSDGSFMLDEGGNKIPEKIQVINDLDQTIIGNPNPDFTFGFNTSFRYKKLDVSMLLTGQIGGSIYWADYGMMIGQLRNYNMLKSFMKDSWIAPLEYQYSYGGQLYTAGSATGNTDNATVVSARGTSSNVGGNTTIYRNNMMNSAVLFDASYLRISNLTIGYTFSLPVLKAQFKTSLSVNNLFTFTKYPGFDPAASAFVKSTTRQGVDFGSYPSQRTIVAAFSLTL